MDGAGVCDDEMLFCVRCIVAGEWTASKKEEVPQAGSCNTQFRTAAAKDEQISRPKAVGSSAEILTHIRTSKL